MSIAGGEEIPFSDQEQPQRASLRKTLALYAGGNSVATALQMLGGFLSTRLVEPAVLGLFHSFGLVVEYLPLLGLGAFEGLDRQVPYYQGKNEPQRVRSLVSAAQAWAAFLGFLSAAAFAALALWNAVLGNWLSVAGWGTNAVLAFLVFFSTSYLETLYRSHHDFSRLSRVLVARSIANICLVAAVWCFQFYGLCLRTLGILLVGSITLWRYRPARVPFRLDWRELGALIKVGTPVMMVGQAWIVWALVNRTLVLNVMGARGLGLYALYPMMAPPLCLLPTAVAHVLYPRIVQMYGAGASLREITRYVVRPLGLLALGMIPVVAAVWLVLPLAVEILLPNYAEGVSAARWSLLDVFGYSLMQVRIVFFTVRKQHLFLAAMGVGLAAYVVVLLALIREAVYLEAFAQAMLAGRAVYIALAFATLAWLCRKEGPAPDRQRL